MAKKINSVKRPAATAVTAPRHAGVQTKYVPAFMASAAGPKGVPVNVPYKDLPVWTHAEYGPWKPVQREPVSETDLLYWEKLTGLIVRKWPVLVPGAPWPAVKFASMKPSGEPDAWCSIEMIIVEKPAGADWSAFMKSLRDDNLVQVRDYGRYAYLSPFFEWGLADYWENGYYDR